MPYPFYHINMSQIEFSTLPAKLRICLIFTGRHSQESAFDLIFFMGPSLNTLEYFRCSSHLACALNTLAFCGNTIACMFEAKIVYDIFALVPCYRVSNIFASFSNLRYPNLHYMLPNSLPSFPAVFDLKFLAHAERKEQDAISWLSVYLSHNKGS